MIEHVPVGVAAIGGQVFACDTAQCAMTISDVAERHMDVCIICGPGCCAPVLGVHTSCPGPAAGATVVAR